MVKALHIIEREDESLSNSIMRKYYEISIRHCNYINSFRHAALSYSAAITVINAHLINSHAN